MRLATSCILTRAAAVGLAMGLVGCEGFVDLEGLSGGTPPMAAGSCAAPRPEWVFCSEFEEGSKALWDDFDGNPDATNRLVEDPGPLQAAGNHVMLLELDAAGVADVVKEVAPHDVLYARWYVHFPPGHSFGGARFKGGLHAGSRGLVGSATVPSGDDFYAAYADTGFTTAFTLRAFYPEMYQPCEAGECAGDQLPCLADDGQEVCVVAGHRPTIDSPTLDAGWHCIEVRLDAGSSTTGADGALDLFVDDVELGPWTGLSLRDTQALDVNVLWLLLLGESGGVVLIDHVVVSTSRVGCF